MPSNRKHPDGGEHDTQGHRIYPGIIQGPWSTIWSSTRRDAVAAQATLREGASSGGAGLDAATVARFQAQPSHDDNGNRVGTRERLRRARETTPEVRGSSRNPITLLSPSSPKVQVVGGTRRVAGSSSRAPPSPPRIQGSPPRMRDVQGSPSRPRGVRHSVWRFGYRVRQNPPLSAETLYRTAPHHMCGICFGVKEHPVSYQCGHSHCFVCIRFWLEKSWRCPECLMTMYCKPFRHWPEEAYLAAAYPGWGKDTQVNYSWKGLQFPKESM
ncbi:hypothetical protein B0H14DRAFT_3503885 [Mycena olivaceomarginata]|nr:hypothetical protein B0H14DRAFT_3503885 [Mycena olivaceomarginata]